MQRPCFNVAGIIQPTLRRYPRYATAASAVVSARQQKMYIYKGCQVMAMFPVSTSRYGLGNQPHSFRTPCGVHRVYRKIGQRAALLTRFIARRAAGTMRLNPLPTISMEDAICTRILWLESFLPHIQRHTYLDSKRRYIYIHGTCDEKRIGQPASKGCIRMKNEDVCKAFEQLDESSLVYIIP